MAKDKRIWVRVATQMPDSPKIAGLSDAAFRAQVEALCYCSERRTDGFIPRRVAVQRWGEEVVSELLSNDPADPSWVAVEGGFEIHDYLEHQESRASIEARELRLKEISAAGVAARNANRLGNRKGNHRGNRDGLPDTDTDLIPKGIRARGTRVPDSFPITDEMRAWAAENTPLVDLDAKLDEWLDYWRSVPGQRGVKLDWVGTWRNGMRKQQEFAERDGKTKPAAGTDAWMARREIPAWKLPPEERT